jgi:site-specific DNA-methyltransferase (adenine-specific)
MSDCELAYSSFQRPTRIWVKNRVILQQERTIHPTQKPIKLYDWLLSNYAKPGDRILDTHLGSGSSAIAAHYAGHDFVGVELDDDYYKSACNRFDEATRQEALF